MILDIDWDLLSRTLVPDTIRERVERRLAVLWRFLDCSRARTVDRPRCRSEDFKMSVGGWTFTYQVDVSNGAAIVRWAEPCAGWLD